MKSLRLHGGDAGKDGEDLGVPGGGNGGVEEEFVHFGKDFEIVGREEKTETKSKCKHGLKARTFSPSHSP